MRNELQGFVNQATTTRQSIHDALDDSLRLGGEDAGELLLVRHAEPACNSGADPLLSCAGLEQAERLAERMSGFWLEGVYTATERRTQQTARILADATGRPLHVIDGLNDIGFDPSKASTEGAPDGYVARFGVQPRWDELPGFEGSRQFRRRAIQTIERILAISSSRRVALVTHASVINAYVSMLLSIPADQFFAPEHASVSVIRWSGGRYALRSLNDVSHLGFSGPLPAAEGQLLPAVHAR